MFKTLAAACAVAVLPVVLAPSAHAAGEYAPVTIDMTPVSRIKVEDDGTWRSTSYGTFKVTITDISGYEELDEVTAFISIPGEVDVIGTSGDGWSCWDVDGGVECHNGHVVVPGEAWPDLQVGLWVNESMDYVDSLDVYASTGPYKPGHSGVPFTTF